ncbi:MAG: 30S ribosomal protein S16 [Candidatus Nomurabacteria bacterium]|nr:30S ribosomal protein S16 [Candidatus Nomurabacteria bacterium]
MLAIRLQRRGRKGYSVYRVIIQEAKRHPSSGRVVAQVGIYNPHTKQYQLDKEKIEIYLKNGAQPTPRVVKLLQAEKINLPKWVEPLKTDKAGKTRVPDKLRKNQPAEKKVEGIDEKEERIETAEEITESLAQEPVAEESIKEEIPAEEAKTEAPATEEKPAEAPAEETAEPESAAE